MITYLSETSSTNDYLRALSADDEPEEFTVVCADFQTGGRGQRGCSWESEVGKNLLFSLLLCPNFIPAREQFLFSQIIALSIKDHLSTFADGFSIKWPNDIYWHEKKICGILIENDLSDAVIVRSISGIGININQEVFKSSAPNPISLKQIVGRNCEVHDVLKMILFRVRSYYELLKNNELESIRSRYHHSLFRREGFHCFSDATGDFMACIVRVADDGTLVLEDEKGVQRNYLFKEVAYIL